MYQRGTGLRDGDRQAGCSRQYYPLDDDDFWSLVRGLAPRQQAVIVLRYVEDLTVEETAAVLGIEAGTIKSAAAAGRRRLANVLEAHDRPEGTAWNHR